MSKTFLIASFSAFSVMMVLDFIWLSNAVGAFYRPRIGAILADKPVTWAAISFYLLYGAGIAFFVVRPALGEGPVTALWMGALLGLVAYGTYDLTNQATVKDWPVSLTVVDLAWGVFVTAMSSAAGVWIGQKLG